MCTVLLPPGDNPIAINKYIISYKPNLTYNWQYLGCMSFMYDVVLGRWTSFLCSDGEECSAHSRCFMPHFFMSFLLLMLLAVMHHFLIYALIFRFNALWPVHSVMLTLTYFIISYGNTGNTCFDLCTLFQDRSKDIKQRNLTFRAPCIVIYSYNISQRDAQFLTFIW